jgi:hypothetical protein
MIIAVTTLGMLVLIVMIYRSCGAGGGLNVDPHAREEIEKAKKR